MWGNIQIEGKKPGTVVIHVAPVVEINGEFAMSAAHEASMFCPCHPTGSMNNHGVPMVTHHDEEHPGSLERVASGEDKDHGIQ